jgi:hypothetical protein
MARDKTICADCGHSAGEHSAGGRGGCRHGLIALSTAPVLRLDARACCRCRRFRVRPRPADPGRQERTGPQN